MAITTVHKGCKKHEWISFGDGGFCPKCGMESTVFGMFYHGPEDREAVAKFYRGEIDHAEVDRKLIHKEAIPWRFR